MGRPWSSFYWRDYVADTGHLPLQQHGAYLLLMCHYYMTRQPLPANADILHRICRCTTDAEKFATDEVLAQFFTLEGEVYRHKRIDKELERATEISEVRRTAAKVKHEKEKDPANAPANVVQMHTQPQSQPQPQLKPKSKTFVRPTLEEITAYCQERGNQVDPLQWLSHYEANGWMVGKVPMKDWKAAVRTWENNDGNTKRSHSSTGPHAERTERNREAILAGLGIDANVGSCGPDHPPGSDARRNPLLVGDVSQGVSGDAGVGVQRIPADGTVLPETRRH